MKSGAFLAALAALTISAGAYAAQITGGDSSVGTYDFHHAGAAAIDIASPGLTGVAFFPAQLPGTYTLGTIVPPVVAGPLVGGNFATDGHELVSVTVGSYSLTGDFHFDLIKDHSAHPDVLGELFINTSTFPGFAAGTTVDMDVTLTYLSGVASLDELALNGGAGTWEIVSTFEIVNRVVPEPQTLFLLGGALIALGILRRLHIKSGAPTADEQLVSVAI